MMKGYICAASTNQVQRFGCRIPEWLVVTVLREYLSALTVRLTVSLNLHIVSDRN